jgi:DNA-binding protein YbaB
VDPQQWLGNFEAKVADLQRKSSALQESLAEASATVSSSDGSVTVRIGPNGGLENLELSHRAAEHSPARLTGLIMETVRKGQRKAAGKLADAFAPMGESSEAMRLISSLAPPSEEPENAEEDLFPVEEATEPESPQAPRPVTGIAPAAPQVSRARPGTWEDEDEEEDEVELW